MIVCKFGGTSVANVQSANNIKEIIKSDKNRKIIVVSALGKVYNEKFKITDKLYYLYNAIKNNEEYLNVVEDIFNRYIKLSKDLHIKINWTYYKKQLLNKINTKNITRDYLVSRGEYYSAKLYSKFLGAKFLDAKDYIVVDSSGRFIESKTRKNLKKLNLDNKYVIGGFYGRNNKGEICVFDRGGSDITGAIICKCLNAEIYENYTDVNGVYDKNPNIFKHSNNLPILSFKSALYMANSGNEVVHKDALKITRQSNTMLIVKSTFEYEKLGTIIVNNNISNNNLFACMNNAYVIILDKLNKQTLEYLKCNADIIKVLKISNMYYIIAKSFYLSKNKIQCMAGFVSFKEILVFLFFYDKIQKNGKKLIKIKKKFNKNAIFIEFLSYFNNLIIALETKGKDEFLNGLNKIKLKYT